MSGRAGILLRALGTLATLGAAPASAAGPPSAQQERGWTLVEVVVTAVSGDDVYLDRGRDDGLEPGDEVRLRSFAGGIRHGVVRSVASASSRAELLAGGEPIEIGATGEVRVPGERLEEPAGDEEEPLPAPPAPTAPQAGSAEAEPAAPRRSVPEHPPWAAGPLAGGRDAPLLAPIAARTPAQREWRARGRLRTSLDWTRDDGDAGVSYWNARTGVALDVENPFGKGGALALDTGYYLRHASVDDGEDDSDSRTVVDRLSYRIGGQRGAPNRFEVGRFLHHLFPEFGLIDGVEAIRRTAGGDRYGISVGLLPEPDDALRSGEDLSVSLFYHHVSDPEETLAVGIGYQKTWHEGEADRDLVVGKLSWTPARRARVFASAWVDLYTSSDEAKGSGAELTQLLVNASKDWERVGVGLFATQIRFPELLRDELGAVTIEDIAGETIRRIGLRTWLRQSERLRWDGRVDAWSDEDDSGAGGDLRLTARDLLWERGSASVGVFTNTGDFASGAGLRLSATRLFGRSSLRGDYDVTRFDQDSGTAADALTQHTLSVSLDTSLGESWDVSLFAQEVLRDGDNSVTLGVTLQKRF